MTTILIASERQNSAEQLLRSLEPEGFRVAVATNGAAALAQVFQSPPDFLVIDHILPEMSGPEVCHRIRHDPSLPPLLILMVGSGGEEADCVAGLEAGADDYVQEPSGAHEIAVRIKALLHHQDPGKQSPNAILHFGDLSIDTSSHRVVHLGRPISLSATEFRLLLFLASHPNRLFSREALLQLVWGPRAVTDRSVDVYVRRLRSKIERDPKEPAHLRTVRGFGYVFDTA